MLTDSRSRLASPSRRSPMKVAKLSEVPRQSMSRATKFFHGAEHVSRQGLTDESTEVSVNVIHFDHGAHTHMHIHGCDQVLLVTKGKAFFETENDRTELSEGDVVFAPKGEKHRHGATAAKDLPHVSITRPNSGEQFFDD